MKKIALLAALFAAKAAFPCSPPLPVTWIEGQVFPASNTVPSNASFAVELNFDSREPRVELLDASGEAILATHEQNERRIRVTPLVELEAGTRVQLRVSPIGTFDGEPIEDRIDDRFYDVVVADLDAADVTASSSFEVERVARRPGGETSCGPFLAVEAHWRVEFAPPSWSEEMLETRLVELTDFGAEAVQGRRFGDPSPMAVTKAPDGLYRFVFEGEDVGGNITRTDVIEVQLGDPAVTPEPEVAGCSQGSPSVSLFALAIVVVVGSRRRSRAT